MHFYLQSKTTRTLVRQGSANVYGCEVGDAVLVQWDERYSTHMLYNRGPYLHFLHADSILSLNLKNVIEPFLARVLQREFCLVRKVFNVFEIALYQRFRGVVVITSALHAEGLRFDPGRNLPFLQF